MWKKKLDKEIFGQKSVGSRENEGSKKFAIQKNLKEIFKKLVPYIFFMSIRMLVQNNFGVCWVQRECGVQNILRLKIIGIQKIWVQTNVTRTNKNSCPKKVWIQKTLGPKNF